MSGHDDDPTGGVYDDLELPSGTLRPFTAIQMVMTVDGAIKGPTDDLLADQPGGGPAHVSAVSRAL